MADHMIKVMLVDDEENVRNLLRICIDWNEIGMEIAGEASSGREALDMLEEINPDIIFSDICMPYMDGLEFSGLAKEQCPHAKIVILTAYEGFGYAQKGIKIGISDFILKPINRAEIRKSVLNLKTQIEKERAHNDEFNRLKNQFKEYLPSKKTNKVISDVMEYINKNVSNLELSLASTAKEFYLNPSYLSRVFKQETGQSFIGYLTKVRMEKSLILLKETDMKVYEIAEAIGIQDPNYFSMCFKKFTGMSVNDYKKCNRELGGS